MRIVLDRQHVAKDAPELQVLLPVPSKGEEPAQTPPHLIYFLSIEGRRITGIYGSS